jgi:hypothetical protein
MFRRVEAIRFIEEYLRETVAKSERESTRSATEKQPAMVASEISVDFRLIFERTPVEFPFKFPGGFFK